MLAIRDPLHITLLVLAVLAGLISAWWLFPVGLILWLGLVLIQANDPLIRSALVSESRAASLTPRYRALFEEFLRVEVRLRNTLRTADRRTRRAFAEIPGEVQALTEAVFALCQRMTGPENYLRVTRDQKRDLEGERALLVLAKEGSQDPAVRAEKAEALRVFDARLTSTKSVEELLDQVEVKVRGSASELNAVLAEVVRLQATGADRAVQQAPVLMERIRKQHSELRDFEAEAAKY